VANSASSNRPQPEPNRTSKLRERVENWGMLGAMIVGIGGGYLLHYLLGREFGALGLGVGYGVGSTLGFVTGALVHRQPLPVRRLTGLLLVWPICGIGVALVETNITALVFAIPVWAVVALTAGWALRQWTIARAAGCEETPMDPYSDTAA
jgi:hypothetical protein